MSPQPTSALLVTTFVAVALICISSFAHCASLPYEEVQVLKIIGGRLGKNFSADPCTQKDGLMTRERDGIFTADAVVCNCSYANNTVCHVVSIALKNQSLSGILPPELVDLPFLQNFDVSRNYLNGTIPSKWGAMPSIIKITLLANRLISLIPKELGNLSTLENLVVEANQLSGPLPSELGNLTKINRLLFRSNYFTGELSSSFAKLITLTDLRLGDNNFTGQIPNFIWNLANLKILEIQASGLRGPITEGIKFLGKLVDLKISDLNGTGSQFPVISSSNIKNLVLRNCNISGNLPEYLAGKTSLVTLDVSFNKLTGVIPRSYSSLPIGYMFLTGNQLTGSVPDWIFNKGNIDISYNNFTNQSSSPKCQVGTVNMFASSSKGNTTGIATCLSDRVCSKPYYNLYINCGGSEVTIEGIKYDGDSDLGGASQFVSSSTYHWGSSTTGYFPDNDKPTDLYTATNTSKLLTNNPLYMSARLSPVSLTYYAFCLMKGSYTLHLHFAEIMFTNDQSYTSLGRRIFDVYIQGQVILKDFDIAAKAGGAKREFVENCTVMVTDGILEIRFYWAGKGTGAIPQRGVYGPLISAISLIPIVGFLWWQRCTGHKDTIDEDLKGLDLKIGSFTLRQIAAATNNFDPTNKIGEGGFGSVYKGLLLDGTIVAVKQLSSKSKQGNREFVNEIGMISALQHPHLVKLYGSCIEGNQLLLVYEYMENNSLAQALFGPKEPQLKLDWATRHRICIGIARGLAYLHEESRLKIVHRDIKATNVLLDKDLIPKISDFGLAKLDEEGNTHISTRIAGTIGYMAPEYATRGYLTDKADVYSFGIVALEIVSGKSNTSYVPKDECFCLLDWANVLKEKGNLIELIDPRLGSNFNKVEVMTMINVALLCTNASPTIRPAMSYVVSMLEGKIKVEASPPYPTITIDEVKVVAMRRNFSWTSSEKLSENVILSISMEDPQAASKLANDLSPMNLDSTYLLSRD